MLPLFHATTRNPEDQGGNSQGSKRNMDASYYIKVILMGYV